MGIFDKAKDAIGDHPDQVDQGISKAGDLADDKTGNKYTEKIDQGENLVKDHVDDLGGADNPPPA